MTDIIKTDTSILIDGLFEKEALFTIPGIIAGGTLGLAGGATAGIGLANVFHPPTKKVKSLRDESKATWDLNREKQRTYDDMIGNMNSDDFDELINTVNHPDFDDKTVGEVEDYTRQFVDTRRMNKQAGVGQAIGSYLKADAKKGLKAGLISGAITAPLIGVPLYKNQVRNNSDAEAARAGLEYAKDINEDLGKKISHPDQKAYQDVLSAFDHQSEYSPSLLSDKGLSVACEGQSFYGRTLNKALSDQGIDYKKIPWGQYKKLLTESADSIAEYDGNGNLDPIFSASGYKKASDIIDELFEKLAADDIAFHASPVQGIEKFRFGEDTSGNNKGKVIFVSHDQSFCSAFGVRWNDTNARLVVETTNQKPPTNANYKGTVLKITDDVDLDKPCSMYTLRGKFKPLRYENDVEEYTNDPVEIISEEKFSTFKEMAKHYGLEIKDVRPSTIIRGLKDKKTSNFEKGASEMINELCKEAGVVGNFLGRNISKAERELSDASAILATKKKTLGEQTRKGFLGKTKPMYSEKQIGNMTAEENGAVGVARNNREKQVGKTFNTRLGVGALSGGGVAYQMKSKQNVQDPGIEPNYNPNYQPDNYMYMSASELIDDLLEKTAGKLNFSAADNSLGRFKEIATFGAARKANKGLHYIAGTPKAKGIDLESNGFKANSDFINTMKKNYDTEKMQDEKIKGIGSKIKKMGNPDTSRGKMEPHEMYNNSELSDKASKALEDAERRSGEMDKMKSLEEKKKTHTHRRVQQDYKTIRNYRDNEVAKGLAIYSGAALLGKGGYDIATKDKSASELIDALYKDAGVRDILLAHRNVGAAKKTLKHMNHRNELGLKNRDEFGRHVKFMADAIEQGHHIPTKRIHELANFDLRSQGRVMHAGERVQKATDNLDIAKQNRKNEIKNTFSFKKMKEDMI